MAVVPIQRYFNPAVSVRVLDTEITFRNGQGLNIGFNVRRTLTATPDTARISVAGIDPLRARKLGAQFAAVGRSSVTLRAGYDQALVGLFEGDLRNFSSGDQRGPDLWTTFDADDGGDAISNVVLRISSGTSGLTAQNMIDIAAKAMGLDQSPSVAAVVADPNLEAQAVGPYTAVMVGKATDLLDQAARRLGARWWVRDGQIFLARRFRRGDANRPAVAVPPEALTTVPTTSGLGQIQFDMFLDPNVVPGSQVVLEGAHVRVESVVYSGQTRGGSVWTSRVVGTTL